MGTTKHLLLTCGPMVRRQRTVRNRKSTVDRDGIVEAFEALANQDPTP
jgi:hypothetical protein